MSSPKTSQSQATVYRIFIIYDQFTDMSYLYQKFGILPMEEEATSLRFQIFNIDPKFGTLELYIFPKNRQFKTYCHLYTSILQKPDLIIYAIDTEASIKESIEWLSLFQNDSSLKICFFSSAKTYNERHQVLTKINTLFIKNIDNHVYFPKINQESFQNCIFNLKSSGISMQNYARLMPAVSRLKWIWKKITNRKKAQQEISVI